MSLSKSHTKPLPEPDTNGRIILTSSASTPLHRTLFLLGFSTILLLCLYYLIHMIIPQRLPGLPALLVQNLESLGIALLWLFTFIPPALPSFPGRTKLVIDNEGLTFTQWRRTRQMRWDQMRDITVYHYAATKPLLSITGTNTTIKTAGFGIAPKNLADYLAKRANTGDTWAKVEVVELGLSKVSPPDLTEGNSDTA